MSPMAADAAAVVFGAVRLGGVLDHDQAVLPGDLHDRVHVGRLAVEVDRHDGLGPRRDRRLDRAGSIVKVTGSMSTKTGLAPV